MIIEIESISDKKNKTNNNEIYADRIKRADSNVNPLYQYNDGIDENKLEKMRAISIKKSNARKRLLENQK